MGFVSVVAAPKDTCYCLKPNSKGEKYFGKGTIWQCDICGAAWKFESVQSDQRDGDWDVWSRAESHDGPDTRPRPKAPEVTRNSFAAQRDGGQWADH